MKKLVIYFSRTGENYMSDGIRNIDKGNTEIVAEKIKELTDADLFKVETIKDYPYNYRECCAVAKQEKDNDERPKLKEYLTDISSYDTIYIGYPIWYGDMPNAVLSCLEKLDFTGKIIKPFSTNEGSGLALSMNTIKKFCQNADIKEGLAINGSNANESKSQLEQWV